MSLLHWQPCTSHTAPAGLVVAAAQAASMLGLLQQRSEERLQHLSAVATRDLLVLLGPEHELPWLDGVRYCAPAADAPELWLPTHTVPALPLDLVQSALLHRIDSRPLLLWHAPEQVLPLSSALPLSGALLAWLATELN